jgi:metal-responsive CopG/Arc/MetJ family transcriptional regulator
MIKMTKPRQRGRPPAGDDTMQQIALRLPKPMLAAIDEIVADRLGQPERSAIIRELLAEALEQRPAKKGRF